MMIGDEPDDRGSESEPGERVMAIETTAGAPLGDGVPASEASGSSPARRAVAPPSASTSGRASRWGIQLDAGSIAVGGLVLWFAGVHLRLWIAHPGVFVGLGQVLLELLQGTLFFLRRQDLGGRRSPSVWIATTLGSWGFLLARPAGGGYFDSALLFGAQPLFDTSALWQALQLAGTLLAIISLSSLGRSFGLLAANRGVRTSGAYRLVRHPAYASYFVVQIGYLLENLSVWNVAIFSVVVVAQLARIHQEEAVLLRDTTYRLYSRQVRYRLLPGIY